MLEMRLIREQPDLVRERLNTRNPGLGKQVDGILELDSIRRQLETQLQRLHAERNKLSKDIGQLRARKESSSELETNVRELGDDLAVLNERVIAADEAQRSLLLSIPNLPHAGAVIGSDASANPVVREWGEKPEFDFEPRDHVSLGNVFGLFDLERATKISGSGFICYTGMGARLQRGLIQFLLDLHTTQHSYLEVSPPYLVRRYSMVGTGALPKFEQDAYGLDDGEEFLIPTAEVPLTNLHREETLSHRDLPKYYVAQTPCFRREAGSAGKETRGLIRVHQFDKVELVKITEPNQSYLELDRMTADAERVLQLLGLHYRVIELCTGDLGFSMAKTYDIEVWAPGQGSYLEVSSCSNAEDFQARRMNLKFKDAEGKNRYPHTLNGSGTALPRLFVALLECGQQKDGSIKIPEPLQNYVKATELRN